ncbi:MAG: tetratricopeptide repeat protein [Thermodesulfobacteriota bacterium]
MKTTDNALNFICVLVFGAFLFSSCATVPNDQRIDDIPMYGQPEMPRPEFLQKADEDLIKKAAKKFGSREAASDAWAKVADDYFQEGNYHYAMRRYNQAWLLDPQNYWPYWGFGQIMMVRKKYDKAIIYYEKAAALVDDEFQKPAVFNDAGLAYSWWARNQENGTAERDRCFKMANQFFQKSAELDDSYTLVWEAWARSLYEEGNYAEAWVKVDKARSAGRTVHPKLIERLSSKMPEPK